MAENARNLKEWRKLKGWRQEDLADKLGEPRPTFQSWESGRAPFPPQIQERLRKLGYTGPWPQEEAKEATAPAGGPYATASDVSELRGALRAHVEQWERGQEKVLKRLDLLARKLGLPDWDGQ